jgi:thymidylate kinase
VTAAASPDARAPSGPAVSDDAPLRLNLLLARRLEEASIRYCHWKSNVAIDRTLSGDNDIDLLVDPDQVREFTEVLSKVGFVRVRSGHDVPGIESFYGFDSDSDRLVHVHAHYKLVLGDDRTKNYRLPIEGPYIRSARRARAFRIPAPEFEYIVLVIRLVLKYCTWDEIGWSALRGRRARPKGSEQAELEDLTARVDNRRVETVLAQHLPCLGPPLFSRCVATVTPNASLRSRVAVARRLERALQPYSRRSRGRDRALRISRRITLALTRRLREPAKSRPVAGGAMIGIIGGDGSGKSTALSSLECWLGSEFDVRLVHLGKPKWSMTTVAARAALKILDSTAAAGARIVPVPPVRRLSERIVLFRPLVWLVCMARDRSLAYRRAHRFALGGGLVLCDRYPHRRLVSMDVPRIDQMPGGDSTSRIVRTMARLEKTYHRSILPPELLIVLRVDPDIAVERKTTESPESVRRRGAEVWNVDWRVVGAHVVDASQSKEAVERELKALVWSALG